MNMGKRRRVSESEASNNSSILEYLNEDCWRYVLGYVPVRDIIRTESTSRRWQAVMLRYLQGVSISILEKDDEWNKTHPNICYLISSKYKSFECWIDKLGSSVVAAVVHDVKDWVNLKAIKENCPKLETLKIVNMSNCELESFPPSLNKDFKNLQRLCFKSCHITDQCVQSFINDKSLVELKFYNCQDVAGTFLDTLTLTNLKSLVFYECPNMNHILPYDRLGELTQLILWDVDAFILAELYSELDKLPKLERLRLVSPEIVREALPHEPLSSLSHLKHTEVENWLIDDDLGDVLRGCKELQTMELTDCQDMTSDAVQPIVAHGTQLTTLLLHNYDRATDDDVLALITGCPKLTLLKVSESPYLSPALPARAQAAWRARRPGRRLRLDLRDNPRLESLAAQMLEAEANHECTILDYLNEDCWRHVLQYVSVRDVMRTELTCRRWQGVVLRYLQGAHISIIEEDYRQTNTKLNSCTLEPSKYKSFLMWTNKLGTAVVATYCNSSEDLENIRKTCPNLKTLKLVNLHEGAANLHNLNDDFKCLQHLCFSTCFVSDSCVHQLIADKAIEALKFSSCDWVTGECLRVVNTSKLKTFVFDQCCESGLKAEHIVTSVERLSDLTELRLINVSNEVTRRIQPVLDKMPKLEQLDIISLNSDVKSSCVTIEPLTRLIRLKHLKVNLPFTDSDVELLTSCCRELRSLHFLECCCMTSEGCTEALARHAPRLSTLTLHGFEDLDDDGVLALIRGCPQLTMLDISAAERLSPALHRYAEYAWREVRPALRLTIDLSSTCLEHVETMDGFETEEMWRLFDELHREYEDLVVVFEPLT